MLQSIIVKMIGGRPAKTFDHGNFGRLFGVFLCLALVIIVIPRTYAETVQQPTKVASSGETVITAHSRNISVQVEITTHEVQIGKPSDERPDIVYTSCTYSRYPCSVVDLIAILVNGKPITVPRSAFCSLADLNGADVRLGQKEAVLTIKGGDASESYFVKIRFNRERVTGLSLFGGESGKKSEETTYYNVVVGDE